MEVLLVDDQAVSVQVYAAIVRKTFSGAHVHVAGDLAEALQLASARKVDLALLDLQLPSSSGVQTLLHFRKQCPEVPVLVVAATDEQKTIRACLDAGAAGYVPKGQALAALAGAMQSALAARRKSA